MSAPAATPSRPGWWGRNWKWLVPAGCLSLLALAAAFVAVLLLFVSSVMKSSDAYQQAVARARSHPAVVEALGTPVEEGFLASGNVSVNGPSGHADLAIPLSGPKGRATLYLVARKSAGEWSFATLVLELKPSRRRLDLLAEPERPRDHREGDR